VEQSIVGQRGKFEFHALLNGKPMKILKNSLQCAVKTKPGHRVSIVCQVRSVHGSISWKYYIPVCSCNRNVINWSNQN